MPNKVTAHRPFSLVKVEMFVSKKKLKEKLLKSFQIPPLTSIQQVVSWRNAASKVNNTLELLFVSSFSPQVGKLEYIERKEIPTWMFQIIGSL